MLPVSIEFPLASRVPAFLLFLFAWHSGGNGDATEVASERERGADAQGWKSEEGRREFQCFFALERQKVIERKSNPLSIVAGNGSLFTRLFTRRSAMDADPLVKTLRQAFVQTLSSNPVSFSSLPRERRGVETRISRRWRRRLAVGFLVFFFPSLTLFSRSLSLSLSSSFSFSFNLQENIKQAEASLKLVAADPGYAIALLKVRKKMEREDDASIIFFHSRFPDAHGSRPPPTSLSPSLSPPRSLSLSLALSSSSPQTPPSSSVRPRPSPSRTTSSSNGIPRQQQQQRRTTQRAAVRRRQTATEPRPRPPPSRRRSSSRSRPRSSR